MLSSLFHPHLCINSVTQGWEERVELGIKQAFGLDATTTTGQQTDDVSNRTEAENVSPESEERFIELIVTLIDMLYENEGSFDKIRTKLKGSTSRDGTQLRPAVPAAHPPQLHLQLNQKKRSSETIFEEEEQDDYESESQFNGDENMMNDHNDNDLIANGLTTGDEDQITIKPQQSNVDQAIFMNNHSYQYPDEV